MDKSLGKYPLPKIAYMYVAGAFLRLLLPEGVVPWLVWALRGTTLLNAIPWAVENESLSANTLLERCLASKTQNNKE